MRIITAEYEIITPMYLGGANQQPDWRISSYANVLRWWWRALAYARFNGDLRALRVNEALLFGRHEKGFGAGRVRFRDVSKAEAEVDAPVGWQIGTGVGNPWGGWSGLSYLAGQGLKGRTPLKRNRVAVELRIAWRDTSKLAGNLREFENGTICLDTLRDAVKLIGLLGGLGARSRRAFGSLSLCSLEIDEKDEMPTLATVDDYKTAIYEAIGENVNWPPNGDGEVPFSAFCEQTQVVVVGTGDSSHELMNLLGWGLQYYRSWGQPKRATCTVGGQQKQVRGGGHYVQFKHAGSSKEIAPLRCAGSTSLFQFTDDHTWYDEVGSGKNTIDETFIRHPVRAVFGLPQNYRGVAKVDATNAHDPSKSDCWGAKPKNGVYPLRHETRIEVNVLKEYNNKTTHNRRASPLFLHIAKIGNSYAAVCTLLQSEFLPQGIPIKVTRKIAKKHYEPNQNPDWSAITGFIEFVSAGNHIVEELPGPAKEAACWRRINIVGPS